MESEVNTQEQVFVSKENTVGKHVTLSSKRKIRIVQKAKLPSNGLQENYTKAKDQHLMPDTQQSGLMNQITGVLQLLVDITYSVHVPEDGG